MECRRQHCATSEIQYWALKVSPELNLFFVVLPFLMPLQLQEYYSEFVQRQRQVDVVAVPCLHLRRSDWKGTIGVHMCASRNTLFRCGGCALLLSSRILDSMKAKQLELCLGFCLGGSPANSYSKQSLGGAQCDEENLVFFWNQPIFGKDDPSWLIFQIGFAPPTRQTFRCLNLLFWNHLQRVQWSADFQMLRYKLLYTFRAHLSDDNSYNCVYQKQDDTRNSPVLMSGLFEFEDSSKIHWNLNNSRGKATNATCSSNRLCPGGVALSKDDEKSDFVGKVSQLYSMFVMSHDFSIFFRT